MEDLVTKIEAEVISAVRDTSPAISTQVKMSSQLIDRSTKKLGFSKITYPGYTP